MKVLQASPPEAQEKRIEAALAILHNDDWLGNPNEEKVWATAVRELIEIGKPAVPSLIAELDQTDCNLTLRGR